MRTIGWAISFGAVLAIVACEPAEPAKTASSEAASRDLDRNGAIAMAWRDATTNFPERQMTPVGAHRLGALWVVELLGPSGGGLRYAISAQDGRIRERNMFQ